MSGDEYAMRTLQVISAPGVGSELLLRAPGQPHGYLVYWLAAMGVPAKHYIALAQALAEHGIGMALHEWRGIGSSSERASRANDWGYRELLEHDLPNGLNVAARACPEARILVGGHSLGGQLACLHAALHPESIHGLVLVASGAPYWRCFAPWGWPLRMVYGLAALIAGLRGFFPGRRFGFGGNEARTVIRDWSRSGRSGHYSAMGLNHDLEHALQVLRLPILGLRMVDDAFGPSASLRYLLDKMPDAPHETLALDKAHLGVRADHFNWMKTPEAVANHIAAWSRRLESN